MADNLGGLAAWLEHVSASNWVWYIKYLAANDTYAKAHQGGPYLAKDLIRLAFPSLDERSRVEKNPDRWIHAEIDSHAYSRDVRVVFYNSRRLGQKNGRDEARVTQWGGTEVPIVAAESTGSLTVFAYHMTEADADQVRIWICDTAVEEDFVIDRIGPVEPGEGLLYSPVGMELPAPPAHGDKHCILSKDELPVRWLQEFPTGEDIISEVVQRLPSLRSKPPDARLIARRHCEYEMFLSIEDIYTMPRIREGFSSVQIFVDFANAVTNRRKSRAGKSLELHARTIFDEEQLSYSHGARTEGKRTPDFIFPSIDHYHSTTWPNSRLRMLAAKTTCKDRWRQILNEAARIETKHLLTLQEGVSSAQFQEMQQEEIVLVVPQQLFGAYPEEIRPQLHSLEAFIGTTKRVCGIAI